MAAEQKPPNNQKSRQENRKENKDEQQYKGIFWLSSYPKSGNTWVRTFIMNLLHNELDLNSLATGDIASSRDWVADGLGIEISELSHDEIDQLRPLAYEWLAKNTQTRFHKIHDRYEYLPNGKALIPKEITRGVVYLVRNPLDIALSLANHSTISIDKAIYQLCDSRTGFCKTEKALPSQLRQNLGCWSEHVNSWLDADIKTLMVRYEDLHTDPEHWFSQIADFFHIDSPADRIKVAIEASQFEILQKLEDEFGFAEKRVGVKNFFWKGLVGDWQNVLTDQQVQQVIKTNRRTMEKLGYLDAAGKPLAQPLPRS